VQIPKPLLFYGPEETEPVKYMLLKEVRTDVTQQLVTATATPESPHTDPGVRELVAAPRTATAATWDHRRTPAHPKAAVPGNNYRASR